MYLGCTICNLFSNHNFFRDYNFRLLCYALSSRTMKENSGFG